MARYVNHKSTHWSTPSQVVGGEVMVASYDRWFIHFLAKLPQGERPILSLMRSNPFSDQPPHYVRALFYQYRFTTPDERKATGARWHRDLIGTYFPSVSLENRSLQRMLQEGWMK